MKYRLAAFVTVVFLAVGLAAPPAFATPPERYSYGFVEVFDNGDCDGFHFMSEDTFQVTETWFFDNDGSVDRVQIHFTVDGRAYNSENPGKALEGSAHYNAVTDENYRVWTQPGMFYRVKLPDGGVVLMDAGRFVAELMDNGEIDWQWWAGNHQLIEQDLAEVCAALS